MSSTRMNDQIASGWRSMLFATLLLMTAASANAQGGGLGTAAGTAAVIIGDAVGVPGGTATVTISVETSEGEPGSATIDISFDESILTAPDACEPDPRLTEHQVNTTMPSLCVGGENDGDACETGEDCPDGDCEPRLRIQVLDLSTPLDSFPSGPVAECAFGIAAEAPIGDTTLEGSRAQVARAEGEVICGVGSDQDCDITNGVVSVEEPTPVPTATATPPDDTPTPTTEPTEEPTATPTEGEEPTATPTTEPDDTPTSTPTRQPTQPPGPGFDEDDSCAIVPVQQANPLRSLLLLIGPAVLLWGRRRRF